MAIPKYPKVVNVVNSTYRKAHILIKEHILEILCIYPANKPCLHIWYKH